MNLERRPIKGDMICLNKVGVNEALSAKVISNDGENLGGIFQVKRIQAEVDGSYKNRLISLVLKTGKTYAMATDYEEEYMPSSHRYYARWKYLKDMGIPTVDSLRVIDEETVAMGDMTVDGSEFFGKAKCIELLREKDWIGQRDLTEMEELFLQIDPDEIVAEAKRIQKILFDLGLRMPKDDECDILVRPDGTWSVRVVDLTFLSKVKDEKLEKYELSEELQRIRWLIQDIRRQLI